MAKTWSRRTRGLSLLETILSIFLLGMVVLVVMQLFPTSFLATRRSEQRAQAARVAEDVLSRQRALPFGQLIVGATELEPVVSGGVSYAPRVEVFAPEGANPDKLNGIRVTVNWQERGKTWSVSRDFLQLKLPR